MQNSDIQLYQFNDFSFDDYYGRYLNVVNPHKEIRAEDLSCTSIPEGRMTERKAGTRDRDKIENKCKFLMDVLIRRGCTKINNPTFSVNAKILQAVLGKESKVLIDIFREMGYIELGDGYGGAEKEQYYEVGKYSTIHTLKDFDICQTEPFYNAAIIKYQEKLKSEIEKKQAQYRSIYNETFLSHYVRSLNAIHIADRKGFDEFVKNRITEAAHNGQLYYNYISSELDSKNKKIDKVDESGRIYHVLTNIKREIKKYLNISFYIDCKNSHPLLFNYQLYQYHNISIENSYNISNILFQISSPSSLFHNVRNYPCNYLKNNNIDFSVFADLQEDEIEYIYLTSKGLLWDLLAEEFDKPRGEIKELFFQHVYYTPSATSYTYNDFAAYFRNRFPNVYKVISKWKQGVNEDKIKAIMAEHHLTYRDKKSFPIFQMWMESKIFTEILRRMYSKRWKAVNIHDCIVVPDVPNHPNKDEVIKIMEDVYRQYGLCPTFDVEMCQ